MIVFMHVPTAKKRRLSVSRRWRRKRTFLPATRRSSDWMNMYLVPPKCTPPACSSEGSSMPATIFWTSSGETCAGGRMRRQISSRVQRIKNIQRSSTRREGTHFEPGGGGPERAVHAADRALRDVPGPDQVVVDVRLPAHAEGARELLTRDARGFGASFGATRRPGAHKFCYWTTFFPSRRFRNRLIRTPLASRVGYPIKTATVLVGRRTVERVRP